VTDHDATLGALDDAQLDVAKAQRATEPVVLGKPRAVVCLKEEVGSPVELVLLPGAAAREGGWQCPDLSSALAPFRAAGLLEGVPHDLSMHGRDSGPHCACDGVLLLHEGGHEQRLPLAFEEQFGGQSEARAGTKERDVRGAAPNLPAEHE
jgi:hypothetical protein